MKKTTRSALTVPVLFLLISLFSSQSLQATELVNINVQKTELQLSIAIEYTGEISYESFTLSNPARLVLDFSDTQDISTEPVIEINDFNIVNIRTGQFKPGIGRVVLTFEQDVPPHKIEETENALLILFWKETAEEKIQEAEPEPEAIKVEEEKTEETLEPEVKKEEAILEPPQEKVVELEKPAPPTVSEQPEVPDKGMKRFGVNLSGGYYFLQSSDFQDAYGKGGPFIRSEFSYVLPVKIKSFDVWGAVGYFFKSGKLTVTEEDVKLHFTTLSLALRYLRNFSRFTPFVGIGIDTIFYKEKYPADLPIESTSGSDLGFHLQAGSYFDILPFLAAKAQIRYIISKTTQNEMEVNLGGVEYSIGLSYRFDF